MAHEVKMPSLGMAMDEGQVVNWHVKPGDQVRAGQMILEIESEKTTAEIESPVDGIVGELLVDLGATVPVDTVLVRIGIDSADAAAHIAPAPATAGAAVPAPRAAAPAPSSGGRNSASPRARKLAQDLGVDIAALIGSGPGGSVVEADIRAAAANKSTNGGYVLHPLSPMRKRIAERTAESARTAPHFFVSIDIDAAALTACLDTLRQGAAGKPTLNDLILWTVAQTLPEHPLLNSAYFDDGLHEWSEIDLGVVVAVDGGLVVPVIRKAPGLSFDALVKQREDLVGRARQNGLGPGDMVGGTFTVSNLGGFGIERFNSILNRGQSGILSVGAVKKRPTVMGDGVGVGQFMALTLTVDHRVVDGVAAARFLSQLGSRLETITAERLRAN